MGYKSNAVKCTCKNIARKQVKHWHFSLFD